ncbi:hypothetical protein GGX14DRAFT_377893 [Mycena pura]|uniref:CHAT domain-containing protein n=1 Tax=Mycena pura TaxID=153505 RepID=A0AAD6UU32_9AGAR|nr:hypothetical protein GGX14DRAFT_377893 [Mycena pura]
MSDQWALDTLHNLWLYVIEPIFLSLKLLKSSGANRPRLFWRTAGFEHYIPLHAAGNFKAPDGQEIHTCSDYVVSSYIPSFATVSQTLTKAPRLLHPEELKMLLVARETSGFLPSTTTEVRTVSDILAPPCSVLFDTDHTELSAEDVLGSLSRINCFHIACHSQESRSIPNHYNPSTLAKTVKSELPAATFAFVSMCGDTPAYLLNRMYSPHNMASYALKMGFRSLVTVQWEMKDDDGPVIATNFYRYLTEKAGGGINLDDVPYALDEAIQALRASGAESWRWLPFIHIGY